jgi:hypothetical protein
MQKGDFEKSPLYNLIFSVWQALENVSKLKLPDASTIHVTNVEIARIEPEVIERCIGHVSGSRSTLWSIECVEEIKANLKPIRLQPGEP